MCATVSHPQPLIRPAIPSSRSPHIVVGITSPQTCLVLGGRLRTLREAGFRVTLVSGPGELLTRTAAQEGVESIAIPMRREIAPLADLVSLLRLWWLLFRLKPEMTEFSTPKAGLLGSIAAMLCGVPTRVYFLRGLKLETCTGVKRRILLAAERAGLGLFSCRAVQQRQPAQRGARAGRGAGEQAAPAG